MEICIITIVLVYLLIGFAIFMISYSIYKNGGLITNLITKIAYILFWPFFLKQIVLYCIEVLSEQITQQAYKLLLEEMTNDIMEINKSDPKINL